MTIGHRPTDDNIITAESIYEAVLDRTGSYKAAVLAMEAIMLAEEEQE